jgi:hypothetical protein
VTKGAVTYVLGIAVVIGLVVWASIPVIVVRHFRSLATQPPMDWANGTVVAVEAHGDDYEAVVEFSPRRDETVRVKLPLDTIGIGPTRRPAWEVGRRVTVAFDPRNPTTARIAGIGPLWNAIVARAFAGCVSLIFATVLYLSNRPRRPAGRRHT